jgi:thiol-disulfide isomerase/thioredoxin
MKLRPLLSALFATLLAGAVAGAQPAGEGNPLEELKALVGRVQAKLQSGRGSATELAPEIAAFDALREKYRGRKTEDAAQILYVQATLYGQVLQDLDRARALLRQVSAEYPETRVAAVAVNTLESLDRAAKAKLAQAALVGQPAPALHFDWATREGLTTLADLKGKVVVLDFWATWCGPCVASFPQMRELTAHYQGSDVEIVGVTSIQGSITGLQPARIDTQGDPKKEMALMRDYIKAKEITWSVAFSAEPVFNPDYGVTGIPHMAIVGPDGKVRHTGLHPAMPHDEKLKLIDAILREAGLPVPGAPKNG